MVREPAQDRREQGKDLVRTTVVHGQYLLLVSSVVPCLAFICYDLFFSLAVLIESLGCGTLPWRREMDKAKGKGHGVELVCDIADNDIVMTHNTVSYHSIR